MLFIIHHEPTKNNISCSFFESTSTREEAVQELENDGRAVIQVIEFPSEAEDRHQFAEAEHQFRQLLERDYPLHNKHSPVRFMEFLILQAYALGQLGKHKNLN